MTGSFWTQIERRPNESNTAMMARLRGMSNKIQRDLDQHNLTTSGEEATAKSQLQAIRSLMATLDKEEHRRTEYEKTIAAAKEKSEQDKIKLEDSAPSWHDKAKWDKIRQEIHGIRRDGVFVTTHEYWMDEQQATIYNSTKKEDVMNSKVLYEVFVIDRSEAATSPTESVTSYYVVADNPESARTVALLTAGVTVPELSNYHVHAREICGVPLLTKAPVTAAEKA